MPTIDDLKEYVDETCIYQCLKTSMVQVPEEWWDNNLTAVDAFRLFIASAIKIHITNILKCRVEPHLSNTSALNEVKSLDHITCNLQIPHVHSTDFANEVNFNSGPTSGSSQRFRGRGSSRFARGRR